MRRELKQALPGVLEPPPRSEIVDQVWLTGVAYLEPAATAELARERLQEKRRAGSRRLRARHAASMHARRLDHGRHAELS
ncbi:MAG TPA: hypothetical protein VEA99_03605 [Gemmatimonadaceae bacterium]|nr:hypothetical protein [Gemmatimonadaceae bacterium]